MAYEILSEYYDVEIISRESRQPKWKNTLNSILTLGFYDIFVILKIPKIFKFDIIYVQDMLYLELLFFARIFGKKVIYETLDNNAHLNYYHLCERNALFKKISILLRFLIGVERFYASRFAHKTIVNSKALKEYFHNNAELLFYASPLESLIEKNNAHNKEVAFLYLGWFTPMKGAEEILELIKKENKKLYLFGTISDKALRERVFAIPNIVHKMRMDSATLRTKLQEILKKEYLIGLSLTLPINLSNATQEINKDMDYLALGIPILGNHRIPTKEKIEAGCGFYLEETERLHRIYQDADFRSNLSEQCKAYYAAHYAKNLYRGQLLEIAKGVSD